jgi:hypothetical protein
MVQLSCDHEKDLLDFEGRVKQKSTLHVCTFVQESQGGDKVKMFVNMGNQTISVTRTNSSESFKAGSHFQIRMSPRNLTIKRKIHIFLFKSYTSSEKGEFFCTIVKLPYSLVGSISLFLQNV